MHKIVWNNEAGYIVEKLDHYRLLLTPRVEHFPLSEEGLEAAKQKLLIAASYER